MIFPLTRFSFLLFFMWNSLAVCRPILRTVFFPPNSFHRSWWISRLDSLVLPFECLAMVFDGCVSMFMCACMCWCHGRCRRHGTNNFLSRLFTSFRRFFFALAKQLWYFFIDLLRGLLISFIAFTLTILVYSPVAFFLSFDSGGGLAVTYQA